MSKIITISREFGSGGREVGKRLADELEFKYYDRELIVAIANETGMTEDYIKKVSESGVSPYAFQFAKSFAMYSGMQSSQTEILVAQTKILKQIAEKEDCVIVGRGANIILNEYNPMNLFIYADMKSKINRCKKKAEENEKLSDKELEKKIIDIDNKRRNYHEIISDLTWGDKRNYHLCINTSGLEIKNIIFSLSDYIKDWFGGK